MDTDLGFRATCSCPPGTATVPGLVFDPFCGSGTTLAVALAEGRRALGFELNPEYVQMAEQRARKAEREYQPALFAG
jgi:site-specific DNA-methyltransferase (adenine-specific)